MPGDTPHEAVQVFLRPFQEALAVLDGHGQVTPGRSGGYALGEEYAWVLNGGMGMQLSGLGRLDAGMRFAVVEADPARHDGKYRVTTRAYRYQLRTEAHGDVWRMHWHPAGDSPAKGPHLHALPDLSLHLPWERMTFETAIRWCIEFGAPMTCTASEAEDELTRIEAPHRLYRSWKSTPGEALT